MYKEDLTSCGNGLQCASGQCTSRDQQCLSRGTTYNIRKACGATNGCQVTCQDPSSSFACITFPGSFVDGTSCGIGGVCSSGKCSSENFGNNVKNWFDTHKEIVIPVAIVLGLLVLVCLYRCCCYSRSRRYKNIESSYIVAQQPYHSAPPPRYPPPLGGPPNQYHTPPPGWVDPTAYNGPPLPPYSQNDPRIRDINPSNTVNADNGPTVPPHQQMPTPTSPVPVYTQNNPTQNNRPHNEGVL